ncbi:MAG: hypothetical protein CMJ21_05805 [Phycisphaerae bacterium]|nr:hypothetical protein [Phycisphaerae bacterium]
MASFRAEASRWSRGKLIGSIHNDAAGHQNLVPRIHRSSMIGSLELPVLNAFYAMSHESCMKML